MMRGASLHASQISQSSDFDEMAPYYWIHTWFSFGLVKLWRRKAIESLVLKQGAIVCDLMAGTGDAWPEICKRIGSRGQIQAIDFSQGMLAQAKIRLSQNADFKVTILEQDIFSWNLPAHSMDAVICTYGAKLIAHNDWKKFIHIISRILRPGGTFCLMEASLPRQNWLRWIFNLYLHSLQALLKPFCRSKLSLHRLRKYLDNFQNFEGMTEIFEEAGLSIKCKSLSGGFATMVYGNKSKS